MSKYIYLFVTHLHLCQCWCFYHKMWLQVYLYTVVVAQPTVLHWLVLKQLIKLLVGEKDVVHRAIYVLVNGPRSWKHFKSITAKSVKPLFGSYLYMYGELDFLKQNDVYIFVLLSFHFLVLILCSNTYFIHTSCRYTLSSNGAQVYTLLLCFKNVDASARSKPCMPKHSKCNQWWNIMW